MDFKPGEIIAIVVALAIPLGIFAVLLVPGAMAAVYGFVLQPEVRPLVFFGGAAIAFGVLAFRIYRRIRPARRKPGDAQRLDDR